MANSYSEKLKDPRWQKKRLKILERDDWACLNCGSTEKTLHVHHLEYNGDPWDVSDSNLETLCEDCHSKEHSMQKLRPLEEDEANQLVVRDTRGFILKFDKCLNRLHKKGVYQILGDLEEEVRGKEIPEKSVTIFSDETGFIFDLHDVYSDKYVRVFIYDFATTVK